MTAKDDSIAEDRAPATLCGRPLRPVDETRVVLAFAMACGAILYVMWRAGLEQGFAALLLVPLSIALAKAKERWLRRGVALLERAAAALEAGDLATAEALLVEGATGRYSAKQVVVFLTALARMARRRGDDLEADALARCAARVTRGAGLARQKPTQKPTSAA